jgi:hypothetical protein
MDYGTVFSAKELADAYVVEQMARDRMYPEPKYGTYDSYQVQGPYVVDDPDA